MLVGAYPFEDQDDPKNFRKTIQRIMAVQYKIPDYVHISQDCVSDMSESGFSNQRISIKEIKKHPWFLRNLPRELTDSAQAIYYQRENPSFSLQSVDEIMKIVGEARTPPPVSKPVRGFGWGTEEDDEDKDANDEVEKEEEEEEEEEEEDEEDEYDKRVKEVRASGEFQIS
ncbi:hypothetical protein TIFTF001_007649 [Ficus carica]|uniref:Serine/threonine protein kinase n=1 Tax=Ficus carica TaxID=3494 RepID=A0AA87ZQK8_FICCA|nr:hypothetical protein TIFTF001_007649 [Ficus carica]